MALTPGQKACVETLDAPVAVSAGAGSGKTFTLTRRIVHAIETGEACGIDEVLAITFTTKAAGEIKARVKSALAAAGRAEDARAVDGAWISTIHGMCARILREHAVELRLDPAFSVIEGVDADRLRDAAIEEALASANDMVSPEGLDALFAEFPARATGSFGGSTIEDMLKTLVDAAAAHPRGLDAIETGPAPQSGLRLLARVADDARTLMELAEGEKESNSRTKFLDGTAAILEEADAALAVGATDLECAHLIARFPYPATNFGAKGGAYKEFAVQARAAYDACMADARLAVARPLMDDLLSLARLVMDSYTRRKREIAALDNNDLLVYAARALDEYPDIARAYVGRFSVIMVDEFQDTDQLQVDMIKRIAGEGWQRLCTVGDAQQSIYRFRGADVSVFRRHVQEVGERNPDGLITLSDNFRSHADVLAFVDRVFAQPRAFGRGFMSLAAGRDESRVASPFRGDGPRIDVMNVAYSGVGAAEACRFEADEIARRFASLIDAGHSAGDMVVLLGVMTRADVYAAALCRHGMACVVLKGSVFNRMPEVRVMVRLAHVIANPSYTAALFEVLSSGLFDLSADDFIELSTYYDEARAVDRRQSLAEGARRLARVAQETPAQVPARLRAALELLSRMRSQVGRLPMSRIMEACVRDSGWLSRLETRGAEGLATAGNILKAIRTVEGIEAQGGLGPLSIARRFEHAVDIAREAPGALSAKEGDFVRIMTVHSSKGLEFPIVAIAEMADKASRADKLACRCAAGRIYASLDAGASMDPVRDLPTFRHGASARPYAGADEEEAEQAYRAATTAFEARAAACEADAAGDAAERKRLMYVAITRAKEAVVIAMRGRASKDAPSGIALDKPSVYGDIQAALAGEGACIEPGVTMVDFRGARPARVERIDLDEERFAAFEAGLAAETEAMRSTGDGGIETVFGPAPSSDCPEVSASPMRERVFSYSSVASDHDAVDGKDADVEAAAPQVDGDRIEVALSPDDEAWDAIRASLSDADKATDLGTAFHRLAQYAVVAREPGGALVRPPAARVDAICRACRVASQQRARLETALDRWFASSLAARVAMRDRVEAEVPFFVRVDVDGEPAYLEGEIDLLATSAPAGDDGAGVVVRGAGLDDAASDRGGGTALVVDYKTGGSPAETPEQLHEKHLLQATCYAYAVLLQGFDAVELVFVRVEQSAEEAAGLLADPAQQKGPGDAPEPQYVRYAFTAADAPDLEAKIARRAHGKI